MYRSYDPRARILKRYSQQVFDIVGRDELSEVAEELEKRALEDAFFKDRKLYPNVDFYSGLMYRAMGFVCCFDYSIARANSGNQDTNVGCG